MPQSQIVERFAKIGAKRAEEHDKEVDKERRKMAKAKMQEDMRNGGAAAHKAVKGALGAKKEYVQPTHTIQTEEGVSSDPKQAHQAFHQRMVEESVQARKGKAGVG